MITADQIPDEVVEAAARAIHDIDRKIAGEDWPTWEQLSVTDQRRRTRRARADIAAALSAWPGAETFKPYNAHLYKDTIILPLPQEDGDA